jgi:diacylglycerol diphosphate phosphatase/phosphatidate phosphatase
MTLTGLACVFWLATLVQDPDSPSSSPPHPPEATPQTGPATAQDEDPTHVDGGLAPAPKTTGMPAATTAGFAPSTLHGYVLHYGVDYAVVAILAAVEGSGMLRDPTPALAAWGPRIDLDNPDRAVLLDPRLDDVIGKAYLPEKVPTSALIAGTVGLVAGMTALDFAVTKDVHRTHALVLGGAQALLGTWVLTDAAKQAFGRLRPDFRERFVGAACQGAVPAPRDLSCTGIDQDFRFSRADVVEGMRSFPSGHASAAFAAVSYVSWALTSSFGKDVALLFWTPAATALVLGGLWAGAGFTAASRVADHRHHLEDVVVGAALGSAVGSAAWLLHFESTGRARSRWPFGVIPQVDTSAIGPRVGLFFQGRFS